MQAKKMIVQIRKFSTRINPMVSIFNETSIDKKKILKKKQITVKIYFQCFKIIKFFYNKTIYIKTFIIKIIEFQCF